MLEVEADPVPAGAATAHRVDQDVGRLELRPYRGMLRLPAFQARHRLVLAGRARDLDQRLGALPSSSGPAGLAWRRRSRSGPGPGATPLGRLDPRGLAGLLLVVRRPRRVGQARRLVPGRQLEQPVQRPGRLVHLRPRVADRCEPRRDGADGVVRRIAGGHFRPGQRRGYPGVRDRADGIGGSDRAVLGVLVVVHEDAVPLFLPPLGRGQLGCPPLDLPRHRDGGAAHLAELPARLDPGVDVDAARPGGLRPAGQPEIRQHIPGHQGHVPDLRPFDARHRVQVDPELVRVVQVVGAHRMRVQVDAAEVDHPRQRGLVGDHHLVRGAAGGEPELDGTDPVRPLLRRPLLEERLALGAVDEPLQRHRPPAHAAERPRRHGQVVAHHVQLGDPGPREEHLARIADRDLAARQLQHQLRLSHAGSRK